MSIAEYNTKLQLVKAIDANHPLVDRLNEGYSIVNSIYLDQLLSKLESQAIPIIAKNDHYVNGINKNMVTLFGERVKLSNQFLDCVTDHDRAKISSEIAKIQLQLEESMKDKDFYLKTSNKRPSAEIVKKIFSIPNSALAKVKLLNSLRSSISRYRRQLDQLRVEDQTSEKISIIERKIELKIKQKDEVEKALN